MSAPSPAKARTGPKIGYLGGGDDHVGYAAPDDAIDNRGSTNLYRLREWEQDRWVRLMIPRNYLRLHGKHDFAAYAVLLNLITDPDRHPQTLQLLTRLLKGYRGRLLNPPAAVLQTNRAQVAKRLAGIDELVVPKVVQLAGSARNAAATIAAAGLAMPAILREAGSHSGRIVGIAPDAAWVVAQLEPGHHYYLTEFAEARSADGLYRKLRVFFIGNTAIVRHCLISDQWSVHAADRTRFMAGRPELIEEERAIVAGGIEGLPDRARTILGEIHRRMALDFFGIDCALTPDGGLILFEANATMNFFPMSGDPQFQYLEIARERAADAFARMLHPDGVPGTPA